MRKRNTRKSLSLGNQPVFQWQLSEEAQSRSDPPLFTAPAANAARRRRLIIAASVLIVLLLIGIVVFQRLVQRAEENLLQVEAEVANAILLENEDRQRYIAANKTISESLASSLAGTEMDGSVTLLELKGDLALVDLWVSNPVESWYGDPYRVGRIMRQTPSGWRHIAATNLFWDERRTLETTYFHVDYGSRNERAVQEIVPLLDPLYLRLHKDLGLPQPGRNQRTRIIIQVVEGADVRVTDVRYSGNALIIPPPELLPRPVDSSLAETLRQAITFPLAVKIFDSAQDEFPIHCNWRAVAEGVGLWLRWEGHTLPSRRLWEYQSVVEAWHKPNALPRVDDLLSIPRDCLQPSPFLEMEVLNSGRPIPRNELAASLVEYLVATQGREIVPVLLRQLHDAEDWNTLARHVVNGTAAELEAGWQAYLLTRSP